MEMVQAFADDSVMPELVTCGVAVYELSQLSRAEAALAEMKQAAGVPAQTVLHCRVIFSGDARRRSAWSDVSAERIDELVEGLCRQLRPLGDRPLVVVVDPRRVPGVAASDGAPEIRLNDKGVASIAYGMAQAALSRRYGPDRFKLVIDQDKTKIPWGSQNRQADLTRGHYMDLGQGAEPVRLDPEVAAAPKPVLLEVADLYAYTALQVLGGRGGRQGQWFRDLEALIEPEVLRPEVNPTPHWVRARPVPGTA